MTMNTRQILSSIALLATFGAATVASAAGNSQVVRAEFGRDGVPAVTVGKAVDTRSVHVQPYGRDVPAVRTGQSKTSVQGDATPVVSRHGRA